MSAWKPWSEIGTAKGTTVLGRYWFEPNNAYVVYILHRHPKLGKWYSSAGTPGWYCQDFMEIPG